MTDEFVPHTWFLYDHGDFGIYGKPPGYYMWRFRCSVCQREVDVFGKDFHEPNNNGNNVSCIKVKL